MIEALIAACEARGWEATTGIHFNCVTGNFTPDAYVWTKPGLPIDGHDFHEASGPTARAALEAAILSALEDV